jgi:hypothetical protein
MRLIIILLALAQSCPSKKDAFQCIQRKLDTNRDHQLDKNEISHVSSYLWWWQRIPFETFGGTDKIMEDCDGNLDGVLTAEESLNMGSCLDSCFKIDHIFSVMGC